MPPAESTVLDTRMGWGFDEFDGFGEFPWISLGVTLALDVGEVSARRGVLLGRLGRWVSSTGS
jgi:hypothetical protein